MPPSSHTLAPAGFSVDEASSTLMFTRDLAAAPDRVFAAWTEPRQVERWWDPSGERLALCEIDLRIGGSFTFVPSGHPDHPFTGIYRAIERPGLIAFDALGAQGRVVLAPTGTGTRMTVEIACADAAHLARFVELGVAEGTSQTMDNLVRHVANATTQA